MKQAIQFGAGNIGRGFIGALLSQSGYHVVFADINTQMIDAINHDGYYTVHITDLESEDFKVNNIRALSTSDPALITEICNSEIITTAVGLGVIPSIVPLIAKGIEERARLDIDTILHIIACENGVCATTELKNQLFTLLSLSAKQYCEERVGFVDCSVDRIVPPIKTATITDVCVERYYEWNVDGAQLKGDLNVQGMNIVRNLPAYIERKLFTLNTGHAIIAYLGYLKGYDTIEQSIADPKILSIVYASMKESGAVLARKFGLDIAEHVAYCERIIKRFHNYQLHDVVTRIGRNPIQKLSANDRLIAPLNTAYEYGLPIENLLLGVGAAFHYQYPADMESNQLQKMIAESGIATTIEKVSGVVAGSPLNKRIVKAYNDVGSLSPLVVNKIEIISASGIEAKLVTLFLKKAKEYNYNILLKYFS